MMGAFGGIAGYGGGPERTGCGSYCSILDDLSRELLEEDTTAQLQLQGHQGPALDAMVHSSVTTLHSRRVAMNRISWEQHEEPRTPENTVTYEARFDERDGQLHLYHPEAQQFVHDMFTNTARVAERAEREFGIKGLYNRQEHETFLQVEIAVLSGQAAAGMWAAYDASGTVRYVSQIENRDGTVQARWIDVGLAGGDLTPEEGVSLLRRVAGESRRSRFIANDGAAPYIIVEQEALRSSAVLDTTSTVIAERSTNARKTEPRFDSVELVDPRPASTDAVPLRHTPAAISETEEISRRAIAGEIQIRIRPDIAAMGTLKVAEVMHMKRSDERGTFHGFSLVELVNAYVTPRIVKVADSFRSGERTVDNHNAAAFSLSMRQTRERLTIEKIREKPARVVKEIEKRHAEMRKGAAMFGMIAETGVAIHAVPVILARLAEKLPTPVVAMKKSIERHAKNELKKKRNELRKTKRETKKVPVKVQPLKTERVEPLTIAKEHKKKKRRGKVRKENGSKKNAAAELLTPIVAERRERRRKRRVRRVVRKAERILEAKRVPKKEKKSKLASQGVVLRSWSEWSEERPKRTEQAAVAGMSFGWALWMMLTRKDTETPKNNFKRSHPAKRGETLRRQEETLWVLRAIIYYLAALREQAMHNHPVAQINPVQQTIPQYAVIYAFAS